MDNQKSPSDGVSKRRRSTVDEADINGYLNTAKEALYKKTIWELLNKDYTSQKHQPLKKNQQVPEPNKKKKKSNKRVATASRVVDREVEKEQKKRKLSSKINFDVLEEQTGDLGEEQVDETESCGGDDDGGGDYRDHGFQEGDETNGEDVDYGDHVYREDEEEEAEDEDGCDDNDEEY